MSLVLTSHPGDRCVPASALHSHAGNNPHTTVRLRMGTTVRRVAGLDKGRASEAAVT